MGRPKTPDRPQVAVELNHEALAAAQHARTELALLDEQATHNTAELAKFLGYDGPLQAELLEHGIAQQMRRTVEACLETGRMLLLLKERIGHGNFLGSLERLALAPRAAQRFMQAAFKFANATPATHLIAAIGNQKKLIELLVLDDDEIQGLADGDSVRGIEVDEIARMTATELRAALREARDEGVAKDRLLDEKNKKIDKLAGRHKFQPPEGSVAQTFEQQAQLDELVGATAGAELTFLRLAQVVAVIEASDSKAMRGRALQSVQYLVQRLADVIDEHGFEVSIGDQVAVRPEWLEPLNHKTGNAAN